MKKKGPSKSDNSAQKEIRLNKYIAHAGICSRRQADVLITTGEITVNGKVVKELGFKVSPTDKVTYKNKTLQTEKFEYILLNKPKGFITTVKDPRARKTVIELVKNATNARIYPVGRLDRDSVGLLLLTNDGELTKRLTHPKYKVKKIYSVELHKPLTESDQIKLLQGIKLEDGLSKMDQVQFINDGLDKTKIGVELHSGKNRIIRRTFEALNYKVLKLDRVAIGDLTKKGLSRGRWRKLSDYEVRLLKKNCGLIS